MFRRNRPIRRRPVRPRRLFGRQDDLIEQARRALDQANQLYDDGRFAESAGLLAELAQTAQQFNRTRRAAQLRLRAYEAWLRAGDAAQAVRQARAVLAMLVAEGRGRRALKWIPDIVASLRAAGFSREADLFSREVDERLAAGGLAPAATAFEAPAAEPAPTRPRGTRRPASCPQCGARLRWPLGGVDDEVECEYCGTIVQAE